MLTPIRNAKNVTQPPSVFSLKFQRSKNPSSIEAPWRTQEDEQTAKTAIQGKTNHGDRPADPRH